MTLLEKIKASVRIRDSVPMTEAEKARSADIQGYINACKDDLRRIGIREDRIVDSDIRVETACKLYVKAALDYQSKGGEYHARYTEYITGAALDTLYLEEERADV